MAIEWSGQKARVFDGLIELSIAQDGLQDRYYIDCQGVGTRKILRVDGVLSYATLKEAQQAAETYVLGLCGDFFEDKDHATVMVKIPGQPAVMGQMLTIFHMSLNDGLLEISRLAGECYFKIMRQKK